eukprot:4581483-Pyramimonas_sp.AAC.1
MSRGGRRAHRHQLQRSGHGMREGQAVAACKSLQRLRQRGACGGEGQPGPPDDPCHKAGTRVDCVNGVQ